MGGDPLTNEFSLGSGTKNTFTEISTKEQDNKIYCTVKRYYKEVVIEEYDGFVSKKWFTEFLKYLDANL